MQYAVLDCLQGRKYCEAIMDNLLLFIYSTKEVTYSKIRRLIEITI